MRWTFTHGDILTQRADVLVCSANVFLNLSGGVGGEILRRCGLAIQQELHEHLVNTNRKFVERGQIVTTAAHGLPFTAILHAVAVDGFYQTSIEIVRTVIDASLCRAAEMDARRVALTALATGYGRLPMTQFAEALRPLMGLEYRPLVEVIACVKNETDEQSLRQSLNLKRGSRL